MAADGLSQPSMSILMESVSRKVGNLLENAAGLVNSPNEPARKRGMGSGTDRAARSPGPFNAKQSQLIQDCVAASSSAVAEALGSRIIALEKRSDGQDTRMSNLEDSDNIAFKRIYAVEDELKKSAAKVSTMGEQLHGTTARYAEQDVRMTTIEDRDRTRDREVQELKEQLRKIQYKVCSPGFNSIPDKV